MRAFSRGLWVVWALSAVGALASLCGLSRGATSYVVNSAADVRPSIVPTWTAKHTFNGTVGIGSNLFLTLLPNVVFIGTTAGGQVVAGSVSAPLSSSGNVVSITQATAGTSGYLSSTDWTTFNGKLSSEVDPLALHASGGSNTMGQSILAGSSTWELGSSGTPWGSVYSNNFYLGAVDVLFASGGNSYLGSAHDVFLSPGGGASDRVQISSSNPMNFNGGPFQTTIGAAGGASALPALPSGYLRIQVDGTTYALPYYNP